MVAPLLLSVGLIVYGLAKKQPRRYWQHAAAAVAAQVILVLLLAADGTLADPRGDGALTHIVRRVTADGPLMGVWALLVIVFAWWVPLAIAYRGYDRSWRMRATTGPAQQVGSPPDDASSANTPPRSSKVWGPRNAVIGALAVVVGAVFWAGGYVLGRDAGDAVGEAFSGSSSSTDEFLRGFRDAGIERSELERLAKTLSSSERRQMGAAGVVTLDPAQQYEIIAFRTHAVESVPVSICAAQYWHGSANTPASVLTDGLTSEERARLNYLTGLGMGRLIRGDTLNGVPLLTPEEWVKVLVRHGSDEALEAIDATAVESGVTLADSVACGGARALYRTVRDIPSSSPDRVPAVHFLLKGTAPAR